MTSHTDRNRRQARGDVADAVAHLGDLVAERDTAPARDRGPLGKRITEAEDAAHDAIRRLAR